MRLKATDILATFLVIIMYGFNAICTAQNNAWYASLTIPYLTPPGWVFAFAWQTIYILLIIALARTFRICNRHDISVITLWIINGIAHAIWSPLFFCGHMLWLPLIDAVIILTTTLLLIWKMWYKDIICSALLMPYGTWIIWAAYLNTHIAILNSNI